MHLPHRLQWHALPSSHQQLQSKSMPKRWHLLQPNRLIHMRLPTSIRCPSDVFSRTIVVSHSKPLPEQRHMCLNWHDFVLFMSTWRHRFKMPKRSTCVSLCYLSTQRRLRGGCERYRDFPVRVLCRLHRNVLSDTSERSTSWQQ